MVFRKTAMKKLLKEIKVLVWDLDGTLYDEIPVIKKEIRSNVVKAISKVQLISLKQAEKLFAKTYKELNSSTKTMMKYGVDKKWILSGEWYNKAQLKYIKKDLRLKMMFDNLKNLIHIINTNGSILPTKKKLKKLGLPLDIFEKIYSNADMFGILKPDLLPFKKVIKYTKLLPENHLFIGDRDKTDLVPAKKIGMRTCLVWGQSKMADISLPRVYDVVELFQ